MEGLGGFLFILLSITIISSMIVILVRKYGRKFIYNFYSKERIDKIEKSKIFNTQGKIEMAILILFLIPGTPKDLLTYIGALLPISPIKFITISTVARIPSIISSTLAGSNLMDGNWKISIIIYVVTFIIVALVILIYNRFNKTNIEQGVKEIFEKK